MFLKPLLPQIRNSFHDVSEKVRISVLNLLNKVKCLKTIKVSSLLLLDLGLLSCFFVLDIFI